MATTPIPAIRPLAPGVGQWYPTPPHDTPDWLKQALRRVFDDIYQLQGLLSPAGVFVIGTKPVVVTQAPKWSQIPNCVVTLPRPGSWAAFGSVTFDINAAGDIGKVFLVGLSVSGLAAPAQSTRIINPSAVQPGNPQALVQAQPAQITVAGVWQFHVTVNAAVQLQVQKDKTAPNSTSQADGVNCMLGAVWCGN